MIFKPYYLGCLAHASYLIVDDGIAAVVDPQRDVDHYIDDAKELGAEIRYVIETHLHADFVSGHVELAERTGAEILISEKAEAVFTHRAVGDGDVFTVGNIEIEALATPGHTPESISWLVRGGDEGEPDRLLTGDTLFVGDVGRPDLAGGRGFTAEDMAAMMFDSLHGKLMNLPDQTEVWPAHGAGSSCGRNISKETSSTIGAQRMSNWALQVDDRDEFIRQMTSDLPAAPKYFPMDAEINRTGARRLDEIVAPRVSADELEAAIDAITLVLDVRSARDFGKGHVPGSINIGLEGQFASWAGSLLDRETEILIVAEDDHARADEAIMRLARVGLESVRGVLAGGFESWTASGREAAKIVQLSVTELAEEIGDGSNELVLDVRRPGEYVTGHVPGAINIPLSQIQDRYREIGTPSSLRVICAGGYRSSAAASLLRRVGFDKIDNVAGGTAAWRKAGYETEKGSTQSGAA